MVWYLQLLHFQLKTLMFKTFHRSHFKKIRDFLQNGGGGWCVLPESEEFEWLRPIILEELSFKKYMWNLDHFIHFAGLVYFTNCVPAPEFERVRSSCPWLNCTLGHTKQLCGWHVVLILGIRGCIRSKPWLNSEFSDVCSDLQCQNNEDFWRFY